MSGGRTAQIRPQASPLEEISNADFRWQVHSAITDLRAKVLKLESQGGHIFEAVVAETDANKGGGAAHAVRLELEAVVAGLQAQAQAWKSASQVAAADLEAATAGLQEAKEVAEAAMARFRADAEWIRQLQHQQWQSSGVSGSKDRGESVASADKMSLDSGGATGKGLVQQLAESGAALQKELAEVAQAAASGRDVGEEEFLKAYAPLHQELSRLPGAPIPALAAALAQQIGQAKMVLKVNGEVVPLPPAPEDGYTKEHLDKTFGTLRQELGSITRDVARQLEDLERVVLHSDQQSALAIDMSEQLRVHTLDLAGKVRVALAAHSKE